MQGGRPRVIQPYSSPMSFSLINLLELLVAKLTAVVLSLLMMGVAGLVRAAEIADVPVTEPNYVGILVFFGLFFGLGGWFMWRVMRNRATARNSTVCCTQSAPAGRVFFLSCAGISLRRRRAVAMVELCRIGALEFRAKFPGGATAVGVVATLLKRVPAAAKIQNQSRGAGRRT